MFIARTGLIDIIAILFRNIFKMNCISLTSIHTKRIYRIPVGRSLGIRCFIGTSKLKMMKRVNSLMAHQSPECHVVRYCNGWRHLLTTLSIWILVTPCICSHLLFRFSVRKSPFFIYYIVSIRSSTRLGHTIIASNSI